MRKQQDMGLETEADGLESMVSSLYFIVNVKKDHWVGGFCPGNDTAWSFVLYFLKFLNDHFSGILM